MFVFLLGNPFFCLFLSYLEMNYSCQETILSFINGAYHDWNGSLRVPEHLRMSRAISNRREETQIKSYRTRNRYLFFVLGKV